MLAHAQRSGSSKSKCLIVGICDDRLAMLLAEEAKGSCALIDWISDCGCQYIRRLNWRKYAHVYCSMDSYQRCLDRLNPVAGAVEITIVMTDKDEVLSLTQLPVPTSVKKKYFMPEAQRLSNAVSL